VRLLLRDRRKVRLTAAGDTFRREALEILRRNQEAVRLTKRASLGEVGQLRIGFFAIVATVEAFRELVQSQREAIRALMEARPSEKKQRQGRRP
jgi:DNA-binding transcriptional LysR family regulator